MVVGKTLNPTPKDPILIRLREAGGGKESKEKIGRTCMRRQVLSTEVMTFGVDTQEPLNEGTCTPSKNRSRKSDKIPGNLILRRGGTGKGRKKGIGP